MAKNKKMLWIVGGVVAVGAAAGAYFLLGGSGEVTEGPFKMEPGRKYRATFDHIEDLDQFVTAVPGLFTTLFSSANAKVIADSDPTKTVIEFDYTGTSSTEVVLPKEFVVDAPPLIAVKVTLVSMQDMGEVSAAVSGMMAGI